MDRTDILPILVIIAIISITFLLGIVVGMLETDLEVHDAAVLMLKDPSGACEILRSGKCVIR